MEDDHDNPFVECDLCETMVRFDEYNDHIRECLEHRNMQPSDDSLSFSVFLRRALHPDTNQDGESEEEDDTQEPQEHDVINPSSLNHTFNFMHPPEYPVNNDEDPHSLPDTSSSMTRFQEILQQIREGTIEPATIASFIDASSSSDNLNTREAGEGGEYEENEEVQPLLPFTTLLSDGTTFTSPFALYQNSLLQMPLGASSSAASRIATLFPALSALPPLPPLTPLINEYEYNLSLANYLGKVEKGVESLDAVSRVLEEHPPNELCPICQDKMEDIDQGTPVRKTLCNHVFCEPCIKTWLDKNVKCPVCLTDLEEMTQQSGNCC